ncbi:MAG TPA: hypothetical protein VL985_09825, partial [Stellaceae bacterium]|nr:hypothetical protein [Stellaceae bacterium]
KYGTVEQLLQDGFNQNANYQKASVGALEQITDASNTANARFARDMRNAQIRDQQTPSPTACTALDGGVATQAAAVQAYDVGATIAEIHDLRAEAGPQMPSYYGEAEGVASINQEHINYYCDADDVAAGLCSTASSTPDADQQFSSLFGSGTYADQTAVNTAKDYAINLIEPVAPAALRADQLASTAGQYAAMRRRSYNARMSLAQSFVDEEIGMQTPSVPLTPLQQQYLTDIGLPAETNGSWLQVLQIEAERRVSDLTWASTLQAMPPASVEREIAIELAVNNYLEFQIFKTSLEHTTIAATALAQTVSHDFASTSRMPTPSMQASSN